MSNHLLRKMGIATGLAVILSTFNFTGLSPVMASVTPNPIDTTSRNAVVDAYKSRYVPALSTPIGWTGSVAGCNPGTQSEASKTQETNVINFYRGLSGLDSITLDSTLNTKAQSAALMMHANNQLNHYPPSSWTCYTSAGADAARKSNLFGGSGGYAISSAARPIYSYMTDSGENNKAAGHRRWILNPSTTTMGTGTTSSYNALTVIGTGYSPDRATPEHIPFPNSGYFPSQLEPFGRWSLSSTRGADFSTASVSVKTGTQNLEVIKHPVQNGYGPNTVVFDVKGITAAYGTDTKEYTVTISNIKKDGQAYSHSYKTTLIDGTVSVSTAPSTVNSINSPADIVAYDVNGVLWNYGTLNPYAGRKQIGSVPAGTIPKDLFVTDWNSDGIFDLIVKTHDGYMKLHKGLPGGGFTTKVIGSGWQSYTVTVSKWKTSDKYPSVIARNDSTGELFNYTNPSGDSLSSRVRVGTGWNGLVFNLIDWDKDGKIDIVAKNADGYMKLYRTNGLGGFIPETRSVIGAGWNAMNHIKTLSGHNGPGTVGFAARDSQGRLWYYQSNKSAWAAPKQIGSGWSSYKIAGN